MRLFACLLLGCAVAPRPVAPRASVTLVTTSAVAPPSVPMRSIRAERDTTCAIDANNQEYCWGNLEPKLQAVHHVGTPRKPPLTGVLAGRFRCALTEGKPLRCEPRFPSKNPESINFGLKAFENVSITHSDQLVGSTDRFYGLLCSRDQGSVICGHVDHAWTDTFHLSELAGAVDLAVAERIVCARLPFAVRCVSIDIQSKRVAADFGAAADEVAVGKEHVCVRTGGRVSCAAWGKPLTPIDVDDATQVAAGDTHACALKKNGAVVCWGDNAHGQLGVFEPEVRPPTELAGIVNAKELVANAMYGCALRDTTLHCWNTYKTWAPRVFGDLHDVVGLGQLEAWSNVAEGLVLRAAGSGRVLAMTNSNGYVERVDASKLDVTSISNGVYGSVVVRDGRYFFLSRGASDAASLSGPPVLLEKDYESVHKTGYGGCAIARATRRVHCFVAMNGAYRRWDVLPLVTDAVTLVLNRVDDIESISGHADVCALRANGTVECASQSSGPDAWPTYRPFLVDDLVSLHEGPCGRRRDGTMTCAWYDDPARAALLRSAEKVADATLFRLSITGDVGCALRDGGRVSCFLVDPAPAHRTSLTRPVAVALP